ncbi:MAG: hypothetical protein KGH49_01170 [Candidatus Micrarchaeota archaeon]|nr:hypothetical protein [Candidatus Micrarchaeota archaeon]
MPVPRRIEIRQPVHILILFLIVQFGGLLLASLIFSSPQTTLTQASSQGIGTLTVIYYFGFIILFAVLILLIIRIYKGDIIFTLLEAFTVIATAFFVFLIVIGYLFPQADFTAVGPIALILAIALMYAKIKRQNLRNAVAIISSMGFGVVLGVSFGFAASFLLMALVAVYDYVAVFITKHMITMAKAMSNRNMAVLIGSSDVEIVPRSALKASQSEYKKYISEVKKAKNPLLNKIIKRGEVPLVSQVMLGGGDLGLPLMLSVSAFFVFLNYFLSIALIIGAVAGQILTMLLLQKYMRGLPAIPPLFASMSIALGLALLLVPGQDLTLSMALVVLGIAVFAVMVTTLERLKAKESKTK